MSLIDGEWKLGGPGVAGACCWGVAASARQDVAKPRRCWPGGCQNTIDVAFCIDALDETLARFGRPEIFNTDQGSQFTSAIHLPARRQHRGHDAALGRRCHVAHMPTAATAGNGAGSTLGDLSSGLRNQDHRSHDRSHVAGL
jgi:hypothetical protein